MINACEQVEKLLRLKQAAHKEYYREIKSDSLVYCRTWNR